MFQLFQFIFRSRCLRFDSAQNKYQKKNNSPKLKAAPILTTELTRGIIWIFLYQSLQMNAEIAERRSARLAKESEEEAVNIAEALRLADQKKRQKIEAANRIIQSETESITNR